MRHIKIKTVIDRALTPNVSALFLLRAQDMRFDKDNDIVVQVSHRELLAFRDRLDAFILQNNIRGRK